MCIRDSAALVSRTAHRRRPRLRVSGATARPMVVGYDYRDGRSSQASPVMNRCQLMSLSCDMLIFSTQGLELA
eukprot:scaffold33332_cov58-Phaeocystis_antarctica.AAC.2